MGSLPSEATHTLLCREGVEHPASSQKYQPKVTHITSTHIPLVTGSYMVVSGCEGAGKKMPLARLGPLRTSPHRQWGSTDLRWASSHHHPGLCDSALRSVPLFILSFSILPLSLLLVSHRSFWQIYPHWNPPMGAGA